MLHSESTGSGLPVVLIHGYCEDLTLWLDLKKSLSQKYTVIALDLPGFGKSKSIKAPFNLHDVAETVYEYLTKTLQIKKFVVFGHSLGGYICLDLAANHPESIVGFGLINSTSFADTIEKKTNRQKTANFIDQNGVEVFLQSFVPSLFTAANQQVLRPEISRVLKMGINLPKSVLTSYMLAMANRPDLSYLLKERDHVLFIAGIEDSIIVTKDNELQISMLKNQIHGQIYDQVAHMSMIESPKILAVALLKMLGDINFDRLS